METFAGLHNAAGDTILCTGGLCAWGAAPDVVEFAGIFRREGGAWLPMAHSACRIWWSLRCSLCVAPLCVAVCPSAARHPAVCGAALIPVGWLCVRFPAWQGGSEAGKAARTVGGIGNLKDKKGRTYAWEAGAPQGMAPPASPVATGCQGSPCSTGIRLGVPPTAQLGCQHGETGSPPGAYLEGGDGG